MDALIVAAFARHDMDTLAAALRKARQSPSAGSTRLRGFRRTRSSAASAVATPAGTVEIVAPPARHGDGDRPLRPVPALGAHSDAIRGEFGGNPRSASDGP